MQWDRTTKAHTTKEFFPNIKDRLNTKIILTPNFTAFVTSHGKIKPYLHRFKTIESPDCPCGSGSQTVDHLLFDCTILQDERERLIGKIARHDNWPVNKSQLGNKYIKHFIHFTNSIDFTKLWAYKPGEISAYKWIINNITVYSYSILLQTHRPYELMNPPSWWNKCI